MTRYQRAMLKISSWFLEEHVRYAYLQPYDWVALNVFQAEMNTIPRIHDEYTVPRQ